jgi:hypothetical protein
MPKKYDKTQATPTVISANCLQNNWVEKNNNKK